MKQTITIEDELAMIIDLLTGMVEKGDIKQEDAELIIEQFIEMQNCKSLKMLPSKHVITSIMSYSRALNVCEQFGANRRALIVN